MMACTNAGSYPHMKDAERERIRNDVEQYLQSGGTIYVAAFGEIGSKGYTVWRRLNKKLKNSHDMKDSFRYVDAIEVDV